MSLNLAPEIEVTVRQHAEREGISISELLARTFPPLSSSPQSDRNASGEQMIRVQALLGQW